jgi:hypothetical protein
MVLLPGFAGGSVAWSYARATRWIRVLRSECEATLPDKPWKSHWQTANGTKVG